MGFRVRVRGSCFAGLGFASTVSEFQIEFVLGFSSVTTRTGFGHLGPLHSEQLWKRFASETDGQDLC